MWSADEHVGGPHRGKRSASLLGFVHRGLTASPNRTGSANARRAGDVRGPRRCARTARGAAAGWRPLRVTRRPVADRCASRGGRLPTAARHAAAGCRPRTSGNSPARPVGCEAASPPSGTGPRASTPTRADPVRHAQGRQRHPGRGLEWYLDGGRQAPEFSMKLLLPGLGCGRSATVGFRCAWDLPAAETAPPSSFAQWRINTGQYEANGPSTPIDDTNGPFAPTTQPHHQL
ncbi:hypothetical protein A8926_6011 [Saccharopolyspora spinosa]|uniref:Uncharacterized protein n=1 Tax=Saccharopolyspora spinosa TaxID=60894 RepID=A0A2N3Y4V6_SACSN|nr:hypothetical protein A8926_6011 [Saccharopolyspora spinosa]